MPTPSVNYQVPFGGSSARFPYWNRMGTCAYDHSLNLAQARAARFLPRIMEDETKQAPVVMYPGTIVGTLNTRDHSTISSYAGEKPTVLVPASGVGYKVVYTALDVSHSRYGSVYDIDSYGNAVSSTGTSTATVAAVRPLGIVQEPIYCEAWQLQRRNLRVQAKINILTRGRQLRFAAITAQEKLIYPGDWVQVDDTAGNLDWINNPSATYPGRMKKWDESTIGDLPYVIGRCVGKHRIATGTATTRLSADLSNSVTLSNLNSDQGYNTMGRVQTVPGLGLQGSGTQGVPADLTFAVSDGNGDYWALDIVVGVPGM